MLKKNQTCFLSCRTVLSFFFICLIFLTGCGDRENSSADDVLTISIASKNKSFFVGTKSVIEFTASGGTEAYEWHYTPGNGIDKQGFSFISQGSTAILTYDGRITAPGIITIGLIDSSGIKAGKTIIVYAPESQIKLTADAGAVTIGTPQTINFKAQGGTGQYQWDINFSNSGDIEKFIFSSFDEQGVLSYDGSIISLGTIIVLVKDKLGNFANIIISINNPKDNINLESDSDSFNIGISKTILFTGSGGTGEYIWGYSYSPEISTDCFKFSSAGNSGVLIYNGENTISGTISISIKDDLGRKSEKLILISTGSINAVFEIKPETVGINGQTLCIFKLQDIENNPVPNKNISFKIEQGPAFFIDTLGNEFEDSLNTSGITDSNGYAYARIKTDYTQEDTNVIVNAVTDTGERYTGKFIIDRSHGTIEFQGEKPEVLKNKGALRAGTASWVINLSMIHKDIDGTPLYNKDIKLKTYMQTNNIKSVSLGEEPLPAFLKTDDDGIVDFILKVTIEYPNISENVKVRIGSLVISGIEEQENIRGTYAIGFDVDTSVE